VALLLSTIVLSDFYSLSAVFEQVPDSLLVRLFPDLRSPRLLSLKDLSTEDEQIAFKDYGYSFTLNGDFNQDKLADEAIAGHFDNPRDPNDTAFIAILRKDKKGWHRDFFYRPRSSVVLLKSTPHPDKEMAKKNYVALLAQFSPMPSHNYIVIFWDGSKYRFYSGYDTEHWEGYSK
jgi:hypothetical protein